MANAYEIEVKLTGRYVHELNAECQDQYYDERNITQAQRALIRAIASVIANVLRQ